MSGEDPVDFFHLQMNTLRRYKKHFKVRRFINERAKQTILKS